MELEWPDVNCFGPPPLAGWAWSATDYTIVNSDGVANDPRRTLVLRGGELNSPPFPSPEALGAAVEDLAGLTGPGENYRSNLHVHVRVPALDGWLAGRLQAIAGFTRDHLPDLIDTLDPLAGLLAGQPSADAPAARARLRHSTRSRHYFLPETRATARAAATTTAEALAAEVPASRAGRPQWHLAPREAVNLRALRKHGTVEFRCFAGTRSGAAVAAAAGFARDWLTAALGGGGATDAAATVARWAPGLPRQLPFSARLETGWHRTNLQHNSRADVAAYLAQNGITR